MKKHFIALLSMMMCFVLSVGIFTACYTETEVPKKYTISFYDGDELVDTIETYGNEEISMPAAPKKEGFTFKGWFSDKGIWKDELTKDTFVGQVLTEDVVLPRKRNACRFGIHDHILYRRGGGR